MIDNKVVGLAISQLRQAENMTQQTLAACLNVSHQAVSKWENGAALPDVLTLLEISRMFGVTLEQLLAGDIGNRLEKTGAAPAEEKPRVIELKLDGTGLSDRVNDALKGAQDAVEDEPKAQEAPKAEEKTDAEPPVDIDKIIQMAPFMSKAALEELIEKYSGTCTPKQLSRLAPFVSSECLEKLIVNSESDINWETLRRLAPFLKKEVVDALTMAVATGEKYARPAAETIAKHVTFGINKAIEFAKSMGAQMNGETVNIHVTKSGAPKAPAAPNAPEAPKAPSRANEARKRIFERALADGKWDWIAEHLDQLDDAEFKSKILARARELGMNDWIQENMGDVWDQASVDDALLAGNWSYIVEHLRDIDTQTLGVVVSTALGEGKWDWLGEYLDEMDLAEEAVDSIVAAAANGGQWDFLGEHIDEMTLSEDNIEAIVKAAANNGAWDFLGEHIDEMELTEENVESIASAAVNAGQWDWLGEHMDEMDMDDLADDLAMKAYLAGARDFVTELVDEHADEMDLHALLNPAIEKGDFEFIEELVEHGGEDFAGEACRKLANAGKLDRAAELAEHCDEDTVAALIEIATEAGDWDAIEKLNEYLD